MLVGGGATVGGTRVGGGGAYVAVGTLVAARPGPTRVGVARGVAVLVDAVATIAPRVTVAAMVTVARAVAAGKCWSSDTLTTRTVAGGVAVEAAVAGSVAADRVVVAVTTAVLVLMLVGAAIDVPRSSGAWGRSPRTGMMNTA